MTPPAKISPEMTKSIARAQASLNFFTEIRGASGNQIYDATDLIADLFHLIREAGGNPFAAAENAISHHIAEQYADVALPITASLNVSIRKRKKSGPEYFNSWTILHPEKPKKSGEPLHAAPRNHQNEPT